MGAWIEITSPNKKVQQAARRPRMGAWIEMPLDRPLHLIDASPPYGGVD